MTAIAVLLATILIWELAVQGLGIRKFILPAPSVVLVELFSHFPYYASEASSTLMVTLAGFALAVAGGIALAVAIVSSRILDVTLYTLLVALNAVPKVALAPLFVIWLGTSSAPKVAIACLIAIFPIVIDTVLGLRAIDPEMISMAKAARASRRHVMFKIRFPNALPSLFAGMKVGISFALIGAIVGEFVAGESGLGSVILNSQSAFNTPRAFAAIVLLSVIGTVLFFIVDFAERLLLPWHVSQRGVSGGH